MISIPIKYNVMSKESHILEAAQLIIVFADNYCCALELLPCFGIVQIKSLTTLFT